MKESDISRAIVLGLNTRGHIVWKNHGSIYSRRGLPDISGFRKEDGIGILLEVKRGNDSYGLSEQQLHFLIEVRRKTNGKVICGVVMSTIEAIDLVEKGVIQTEDYWRDLRRL